MTYRSESDDEGPKPEEYPSGYAISGNGTYWGIHCNSRWFRAGEVSYSTKDKHQTVEYAWRAAWLEFARVIQGLAENHDEINKHEQQLRHLRKEEEQLQGRFEELLLPLANRGFGPPLSPPPSDE